MLELGTISVPVTSDRISTKRLASGVSGSASGDSESSDQNLYESDMICIECASIRLLIRNQVHLLAAVCAWAKRRTGNKNHAPRILFMPCTWPQCMAVHMAAHSVNFGREGEGNV